MARIDRDPAGQFKPGHKIGMSTRFQPGAPSPNPAGRPRGVKSWVRELNSRRCHRSELEDIMTDCHAPPHKREAAMRLLLPIYSEDPVQKSITAETLRWKERLKNASAEELQYIVVDPTEEEDLRSAAQIILTDRDMLKPPADRPAWRMKKSTLDLTWDRMIERDAVLKPDPDFKNPEKLRKRMPWLNE